MVNVIVYGPDGSTIVDEYEIEEIVPDPGPLEVLQQKDPKQLEAILTLAGIMVEKADDLWNALSAISYENDARPAIEIVTDAALQAALPLVEE